MNAIEIARKLAALGSAAEACQAYSLVLHEGGDPAGELEAAAYILQSGGNYRISYTAFIKLFNEGHFRAEILPLMAGAFYEPNVKQLRSRYERNCKLLKKYSYCFRKDFPSFEDLPICFFPYDDNGYVPFDTEKERFGEYINFKHPVVSRNFFHDLENPILAEDVYSQYELEYLRDNVRRSEDVARENHLYLHYSDWKTFCSCLQCLNLRPILEEEKIVFLFETEKELYPIDFKERYGIDYSQYKVKPVGIREITRLIWHTQLSTHNGGDFFNEVFDFHPNLLSLPSVMLSSVKDGVQELRDVVEKSPSLGVCIETLKEWGSPRIVEELYRMKGRTDRDYMVAFFLRDELATAGMDPNSRIAPAVFFQPHFPNIVYKLRVNERNQTVLEAENYDELHESPIFRNFKYIKTFTPMRRFTTSHGATVKFMHFMAEADAAAREKEPLALDENTKPITVVSDAISERIFNRSFMMDPEDRLYADSIVVRFEDGKLNPEATFRALAAFLDLPYTETMTYCSSGGEHDPNMGGDYCVGFNTDTVYRTYDQYANDGERYFIEYFLRDAYEYYGYHFLYYDGAPVDEQRAEELISGFTTLDHYIRISWTRVFASAKITRKDEPLEGEEAEEIRAQLLENYMAAFDRNRRANTKILLEGLRFVNRNGQPLRMMPLLKPDPALLVQPLYH